MTACALLPILFIVLSVFRQYDPINDLETAKARWAATGITDYRIVVQYKRPYSSCLQDFDVRSTNIGRKHKDTCNMGGPAFGRPHTTLPSVADLFARIENGQNNPPCGPNGCICDGPIEMAVTYDPERGYPTQITYTLRQDLRNRDLGYWLAMLDGSLANCPQVTYIGQTISVTSLEPIPPLVDNLTEATPEVGVGQTSKPEAIPEATLSIGQAIKPEVTPESIIK